MLLDIRKFFAGREAPIDNELCIDLSKEDFFGYRVNKPVSAKLKANLDGDTMKLKLEVYAEIEAECARCTKPLKTSISFNRDFAMRIEQLVCENSELPVTKDNKLCFNELVYTELVLEVPTVLLCSENCEGLCLICGKSKEQACSCKANVTDERLAVLEKLLF